MGLERDSACVSQDPTAHKPTLQHQTQTHACVVEREYVRQPPVFIAPPLPARAQVVILVQALMGPHSTPSIARAGLRYVILSMVSIVRHLQTLACLLVLLENFVKILRAEQETVLDARAENGQLRLGSPLMLNAQTCAQQDDGLLQQV